MRKEKNEVDDIATRKKEFESITTAIKKITGKRFGDYRDKQSALRVVYLLDRLMTHTKYAKDGRSERILTFIKTPADRFSFEFRSSHPISDSEANTFLLNDLRSYVGIDIDLETLGRIDHFFYSLIDRIGESLKQMDEWAYASGTRDGIMHNYRQLIAQVDHIAVQPTHEASDTRLDHDIYVHLHKLETMHFSGALCDIYEKSRPPTPLASIRDDMTLALSQMTSGQQSYFDTTLERFRMEDFQAIAGAYKEIILPLIARSMGELAHDKDYARATVLADELLYRVKLFAGRISMPRSSFRVSFREITSALCTVVQALKYRTEYRPWIFRDTGQTRSIITPLEKPLDMDDLAPANAIQEGYLQFWQHRREWVQAAMEGANDVTELKFQLRARVLTKAMHCLRSNDIEAIEEALRALETTLSVLELHQSPAGN